MNIEKKLLSLDLFEENEYFYKYCKLIEDNTETKREKYKTQKHHIIPKCFFRYNNLEEDNSNTNIVNLLYKDHVLAHCYLVLASKENKFKYDNMCAVYRVISSFRKKDIIDLMLNLKEVQLAYENSAEARRLNNPMNIEESRKKHAESLAKKEVRESISKGLKEYRKNNPFTEEHRKKLSEAAKGNHNWGSGDTRSIGCYCIDLLTGEEHHFHSYKDGGIWWFNTYHPFGEKYVQPTLQRKIIAMINGEEVTWGKGKNGKGKDRIILNNQIQWFREGGDSNE